MTSIHQQFVKQCYFNYLVVTVVTEFSYSVCVLPVTNLVRQIAVKISFVYKSEILVDPTCQLKMAVREFHFQIIDPIFKQDIIPTDFVFS